MDVKSFVQVYYRELYSRESVAAMARFLTDDYVEHQYTAGFTKAGLRAYVEKRLAENPGHRMIIHHAIQEGDFVFLFVEEKLANGVDVARAELFRTANGRIAEHWGAHVIDEKNRKNDNGTFDGSRVNRDVDHGRKHAARFEELDVRGFDGQELEAFFESRTPDYKQHSPKGGDGRDGLVNILKKMKETGTKMIMLPKRTIVEGDFDRVAPLLRYEPAASTGQSYQYVRRVPPQCGRKGGRALGRDGGRSIGRHARQAVLSGEAPGWVA